MYLLPYLVVGEACGEVVTECISMKQVIQDLFICTIMLQDVLVRMWNSVSLRQSLYSDHE